MGEICLGKENKESGSGKEGTYSKEVIRGIRLQMLSKTSGKKVEESHTKEP